MTNFPAILLMKVGPYCGYSLDEIIDIKQNEEKLCGKYFWGYSGVFCRPHVINAFANFCSMNNLSPKVLFTVTESSFVPKDMDKFTQYSTDGSRWKDLDEDVYLVGNHKKAHFGITAKNLQKVDFKLNLADYCTFRGMLPDRNKSLSDYFKYRVDKACGYYSPACDGKREITISYVSDLVSPFGVYIRK
jgi:hypothetical protein